MCQFWVSESNSRHSDILESRRSSIENDVKYRSGGKVRYNFIPKLRGLYRNLIN